MRCFRNPETIHAICEDYRATFGVDLEMDTKDFAAGRKISLPGADPVGRDRRGRPQSQAGRGLGATTRPTSAAPRRCPAGIISSEEAPEETYQAAPEFLSGEK